MLESASSYRHPAPDRLAVSNVLRNVKEGTNVAVTNLDRATRRLNDIAFPMEGIEEASGQLLVQPLPRADAVRMTFKWMPGRPSATTRPTLDLTSGKLSSSSRIKYSIRTPPS